MFKPLGMDNTYVRKSPSHIIPNGSQGYSFGEDGYIENRDLDAAYGAGAIYTTPEDFAKWMGNFSTPKVGTAAMIKKMTTPRVLTDGDTLTYGFGIGINEYKSLKRYAHGGADIAHRAMMMYYPEINSGVVAFSNNASFNAGGMADLTELFFKDRLESEEDEESEEGEEESTTEDAAFTIAPEELENFAGKFKVLEAPLIIEFTVEEGVLMGEPTGQPALALTPSDATTFTNDEIPMSLSFTMSEDGLAVAGILTQGGRDFDLERLPDYEPSFRRVKQLYRTLFF